MLDTIKKEASDLLPILINHQRYLHQNPEVGDHLPLTTAYVKKELQKMGYDPIELIDSGLVILVGDNKKSGKVFLLRADMDALPIKEESGLPWASQNGNMHACGHDFHTAMMLGVAQILKNNESNINGTVKIIFEPNEEGGKGAFNMIEAGVLENPKVDIALATHIISQSFPNAPEIEIGVVSGYALASSTPFRIDIQGKGSHGSLPDQGVDPIIIGASILQAFQSVIARETPSTEPTVLTVGKFHSGTVRNAIPDTALIEGTLRAFDEKNREFVIKRIKELAEGIAKAYRGSATVKIEENYTPPLYGNPKFAKEILEYAKEVTKGEAIIIPEKKVLGSEDFARISALVPSSFIGLLAPLPDKEGNTYANHNPKASFNEKAMPTGVSLMAYSALEWLRKN